MTTLDAISKKIPAVDGDGLVLSQSLGQRGQGWSNSRRTGAVWAGAKSAIGYTRTTSNL